MEAPLTHSNEKIMEEAVDNENISDDEDEDYDESSGGDATDTDSDDDFEFKDLEREIYGRLGGPPPELAGMIGTEKKGKKASNTKSPKESAGASIASEPLKDISSSKVNNTSQPSGKAKETSKTKEAKTPEDAVVPASTKITTTEPVAIPKQSPRSSTTTTTTTTEKQTLDAKPVEHKPEAAVSTKSKNSMPEDEGPKDDCGCVIM